MMNNFYTTFNELYEQRACSKRYKHLAKKLGGIKKYGKDTPIKYSQILEINDLDDTLWALEVKNSDVAKHVLQLFLVGVAYNVLRFFEAKYPNDNRIRNAIKIRHLYAHDEATKKELDVAERAARPAEWAEWDARVARAERAAEREFQTNLLMEILKDTETNDA